MPARRPLRILSPSGALSAESRLLRRRTQPVERRHVESPEVVIPPGVFVFVDIDERTYNLDPNKVEDAVTTNTKAIMPVHLYGQPADLKPLREIAERRSLWLVEDAAQAHAAEYEGKRCGSIGDLAAFSFYPGKNLGAYGDAGAVTSNDKGLLARIRQLRDHGCKTKYEHEVFGFSERMDALQAAILGAKLTHLDEWTERRRDHASAYNELFDGANAVTPYEASNVRHVYHLYVIRVPNRDALLAHLKSKGIDAGVHYPLPVHRQAAYLRLAYGDQSLPITEQVAHEIISLPMYPELTCEQIEYVAETVREAL